MIEEVHFERSVEQNLQHYIDLAILQTLTDSKDENDGPLKIIEVPLFKGDKKVRTIDRLEIAESVMIPLLYGADPDCKTRA